MKHSSPLVEKSRGSSVVVNKREVANRWLSRGIYFFLIVFVAAAPHSIAVTQIAYGGALFLWILRWPLGGISPAPQRLVWPLLVFLLLSAASASFSLEPGVSWAHMKTVALLLIAVLWAQNLTSPRQVKWFSALLIASCLVNVAYTGWQYTFGIGVKLVKISPGSSLPAQGLEEGDSISSVGRHRVRDREQLQGALGDADLGPRVRLTVLRGQPLERINLELDRGALGKLRGEIARNQVLVGRGHPIRAQGFYDHYVTYADVLVQIALLAFGLFAAFPAGKVTAKAPLGFVALAMASALWLTLTRAAMASFLLGCLLVVFLAFRGRVRLVATGLVVIAIVIGGLLLQRNRGLAWVDLKSPEAQYRLLMWKDGLRLIRDYPWLGIGMDSLKLRWRELRIEAYQEFPLRSHFHSTPIQIGVERGLLTFAAWVWLLVDYFRLLARLLRDKAEGGWFQRGLALGLASAACAFLLGSLTDYNWADSEVVMIFWLFVGWALALERLSDRATGPGGNALAG